MIARRFAAILLLLFATGNAAAPIHPDSPAGRRAFNRCLAQADVAWRTGRRTDALRWYHSAKKVALAHNLTLSGHDGALVDFITRHETGLAGPQPGRTPGCETDGTSRQSSNPTIRLQLSQGAQPVAAKTIPPPQPGTRSLPLPANRTIPGDPTRVLQPSTPASTTAVTDDTPRPCDAETVRSDDGSPVEPPPTSDNAPADIKPNQGPGKDSSGQLEPSPPIWPDNEATTEPESVDDDLVPPVTPTRTSAPPAPPRPPRDENDPEPSEVDAATFLTPPVPDASAKTTVGHPIKLTADHAAAPITPSDAQPSDTPGSSTASLSPADNTSTGPSTVAISDHQLILVMFGPIVIALFLLGLLTQEMPGPLRLLAWIRRRGRHSNSANPHHTDTAPGLPVADSLADADSGLEMLTVKISTRRRDKVEYYTATIEVPGLEPARIVKRRDGSPLFGSRAAAVSSARHLARRLGFSGIAKPVARKKAA